MRPPRPSNPRRGIHCARVPYAARGEDLFGELLGRYLLNPFEQSDNFFICFQLMLLYVENTLYHLRVVTDDLRCRRERTHNADVDGDSGF